MARRLALAFALLLSLAQLAPAQTTLKAVCGWGQIVRLGRWTPVFVTLADRQQRTVVLQIHGTYGISSAVLLHQQVSIGPQPVVFGLLFPVNADLTHGAVIVTDADTGKTLATQVLEKPSAFTAAGHAPQTILGTDEPVIGLAGDIGDATLLQVQLSRANVTSGMLNAIKLPANTIGYEGISALVLVAADLRDLDVYQQRAMVNWIKRGGNLVLIPGSETLPQVSLLMDILPCDIGTNEQLLLAAGGATSRPSAFNGHKLIPHEHAEPIHFLESAPADPDWTGYGQRVGLGRIAVLPANISALALDDDATANRMWRTILTGMMSVPKPKAVTSLTVTEDQEEDSASGPRMIDNQGRGTRETFAIRHLLDLFDASTPHPVGASAWLLLMLLGMSFLLGPVDSIVLMRLGHSPRHWMTILGWVGVFGFLTMYILTSISHGSLEVRTFRLIDQVDGAAVASADLFAIESSRAQHRALALDPAEFWEPANQSSETLGKNRFWDVNLHEDLKGCRPEELNLSAGDPQSFHGEAMETGPAILSGQLSVHRDSAGIVTLTGKLTNLAKSTLTDIQISTSSGTCRIESKIPAGASLDINATLSKQGISMANLPTDVLEIAPERADRIAALVKTGTQACVYCQMPDAPAIAVVPGVEASNHYQVARVVLPLGG